jgi:glycerol uptake facilitator protein
VLGFVIFALTAPRNAMASAANLVPFCIGFTVAVFISLLAPMTQTGWNPARDLGPRLAARILGWGSAAIPGPRDGFWVYSVGPLIGGPLGGLAWEALGTDRRFSSRTLLSDSPECDIHLPHVLVIGRQV